MNYAAGRSFAPLPRTSGISGNSTTLETMDEDVQENQESSVVSFTTSSVSGSCSMWRTISDVDGDGHSGAPSMVSDNCSISDGESANTTEGDLDDGLSVEDMDLGPQNPAFPGVFVGEQH